MVVEPPPAPTLSAGFPTIALGGSSTLTWGSGNATSCTASSLEDVSWSGAQSTTGGTQVVSPTATSTYTLTCDGLGGASEFTNVTVVVGPPPGPTLSADFPTIALGGSSTITWGSGNATSCIASSVQDASWSGARSTSGATQLVTPTLTSTYRLTCDGLGGAQEFTEFTVTVGPPVAPSLSATFIDMPLGGSSTLTWGSGNATSCIASSAQDVSWNGARIVSGGTQVVTPSTTSTYTLTCNGLGNAVDSALVIVAVGPPIAVSIGSDFLTVPLGGTLAIDWSSTSANSCAGTGFFASGLTTGTTNVIPPAEGSQTFTALCTGNGGATGTASVTVTVIEPVAASIVSNFAAVPLGGSVQLSWNSTSANTCTGGANFSTGSLANGSVVVTPATVGPHQYDLVCNGNGGASAPAVVIVTVGPPIGVSVTATPDFIALGGTSTLDWSSTDANSCAGDLFSTGGLVTGSVPVQPVVDSTYVVTCLGDGGATGTGNAIVTVGPPVTTALSADFETIALGGSSTLTWNSANANTCTASSPQDPGWSGALTPAGGSQFVTPTITSDYTLTCVGAGGATSASNLTVVVGPPVVANISADFTFIAEGGSSTLTWTSSNAQTCTGTNFTTGGTTNSSLSVSPVVDTTYTLTCTGLGNAVQTSSVTVTVGPPVAAALTTDLSFIAQGGSASLTWNGTGGAATCDGDASYSTGGTLTGSAAVSPSVTTSYSLTCHGPGNASAVANVTITVGPPPSAMLSSNFSSLPLGGTHQLTWSSLNSTSCAGTNFSTGGNVGGTVAATPLTQGNSIYSVLCLAPGGATASDTFIVTVGPPVTATVTAAPGFIASGGTSTISWSSTSANSCSGNIFSTGGLTSGSIAVTPTADATYTVTCTGDGGSSGVDSATVTVGPAVTAAISANPTFIALGGTSTLSWIGSGGATSCDDDLQFSTNGQLVGTDSVTPTVTTTYELTCNGAGNATEMASVTVVVGPPVVVSISASLPVVAPGGTSTLTWGTTGPATSCNGDFFLTGGAVAGTADVTPTADTTYTATCFGPGGVIETDSVTVTLGPPVTATLTSDFPAIPLGGSVDLTWTSTNATSCSGNVFPTSGLTAGTVSNSPAETTVYRVTCSGLGGGTGTASTSVIVGTAVFASLIVDIDSVALGGTANLTWSSGNANSCTGTGFSTAGATSGAVAVSPTVATTYFVNCDGDGGTNASSSANVTVDPPLSASLNAAPSFIASGGSTTLTWSSVSATSCTGDVFTTGGSTGNSILVSPVSDITYNLTCRRAGSVDVVASTTVTVGPPVQTTLTSEFSTIALGGSSVLTWTSDNATSCTASSAQDAGWTGPRAIGGGAIAVSPTVTAVYQILCTGPGGGTASASVIVTVSPPVTVSLAANPATIALGGTTQLSWSSNNATTCTGDLFSTGGAVVGTTNVTPLTDGLHAYTLTCNGLGNVAVQQTVNVLVGPAVTATLSAVPSSIASGGSSTLTWSSTNATSCSGDIFSTSNSTSGSSSQSPTETTTYVLTCVGAGGASASDSVTISVGPAVTATITADVLTIALGGSSAITWSSANATSCTASSVEDPAWSGPRAIVGGSQSVSPTTTSTYILSCVGDGGATANDAVTVAVGQAVTAALSANFTTIASGGSSTLTWLGTGGATSCSGDIFSTGGTTGGSVLVSPTIDTTYTLTCLGAGGATQVDTLTILVGAPVIASLTVDISSIAQGGSGNLTWSSTNATSCTAVSLEDTTWNGARGIDGGTQVISPNTTANYQLICTGLGNASTSSNVTVTVGPAVTATLTITPLFINLGGSAEIIWSSGNATTCAGTFFGTGGATNGSVTVSPTANTDYALTCTGPGNATAVDTQLVVVGAPVTATIGATLTFIAAGGSSTLSWNGDNATVCTGDVFSTGDSTGSSLLVTPTETTTYTVTCTGEGGASDDASVTISVGPSVTAALTATPTFIAEGGTATLHWTGGGGATVCTGDLFSTGGSLVGSASVNPAADQTYTVTCTGPGGATEAASATVTVGVSVNADISANINPISPGGSTLLTWVGSGGATSCSGDSFSTGGLVTGSISVSPTSTTSYTITCVGAGGASDFATVTVNVTTAVTATLIAKPTSIASGGSSLLTWTSSAATICAGTGFSTGNNPNGNTTVFPTTTTIYTVTCTGAGGATASASATVTVGSAVTAFLTASIETIAMGGSTTLVWGSGNANTCTASSGQDPAWNGARDIAGGSQVVSPVITSTYTLSCDGDGGANHTTDVVVTVGPAVVSNLTATPEDIALGGTSTLAWAGINGATSCEGDLFSTGSALVGSVDVSPTETTTYTVTCYGLGGAEDSSSVTVTVGAPVQARLSANILAIALGGTSTLTWNSTNANSCTASSAEDPAWTGSKLVTGGTMLVSPFVSSTYVLDCVGDGGAPASAAVTVSVGPAVTAMLTASVTDIAPGGTTNLTWTGAGGATSCSGSGFSTSGALTGSVTVSPLVETTYTVTCFGAGGATLSDSVTITVGAAVAAAVTASFETIALGGSSTLTWSSANATTCTASSAEDPSWTGARAVLGGTQIVTPMTSSTYSITCVGNGGATSTDSVTVTVGPVVTESLVASVTDIALGGSSVLTWTSGNAIACTASSVEDATWTGPRNVGGGSLSVSPIVTSTYRLTCDGLGGPGAITFTEVTITVGPAVSLSLSASPAFVNNGGTSTLTWEGLGGSTSCSGDLFDTQGALAGSVDVAPAATTTYTLTCFGNGGAVATTNATVTVGPAVGASLVAGEELLSLGGSTILSWGSGNSTACTASSLEDPAWNGPRDIAGGTQSVSPIVESTYTLVCDGAGGATATASVTISVGPPIGVTLDSVLSSMPLGGTTQLSWNSTGGAQSCTGTNFSTSGAVQGQSNVSPTVTTTYTVTCAGLGAGATATASVTVDVTAPVTATLLAAPDSIADGGSSTLTWSSENASTCLGTGFPTGGATDGSLVVSPSSSRTYSIVCEGIGGAQSAQVNETILVGSAVTVTLTATPPAIALGGSSTLSWTSANATSCVGAGFDTSDAIIGSVTVSPVSITTYQVTCTGAGGAIGGDSVTISVGGAVQANLEATPSAIALGGTTELEWSGGGAATSCTGTGPGFNTGGQPNGTLSVSPTATATYTVNCEGPGGVSDSTDIEVTVLPAVNVTLSPDFTSVPLGGSVRITWTPVSATSCVATSAEDPTWFGPKNPSGARSSHTPSVTSTYSITCNAAGGTSATTSLTVTVGPPIAVSLTADITTIGLGGSANLSWTVSGATSCNAQSGQDPAWSGNRPVPSGTASVSPSITSTYTLNCIGDGGATGTAGITINVGPAVVVTLTALPTSIALGGSSTLTWTSQNATSCVASSVEDPGWSGARVVSGGSFVVTPTVNSNYRLTCTGAGGASGNAIEAISVGLPVTAELTADFPTIALGGTSTLEWSSSQATSCTASSTPLDTNWSGPVATSGGSQDVSPTVTTSYVIDCVGAGDATVSENVTITVGPAVTATFTATPEFIAEDGTSTLAWTSENATVCRGMNFSTGSLVNGSQDVTPGATRIYTLTCTGAGNADVVETVTVTVGNPVTATLTAAPTTVAAGGTSTLTWTSTEALSCDGVGFDTGGLAAGSVDVVLGASDTVFVLDCTGAGNVVRSDSAIVFIAPVPTVSFSGNTPVAVSGRSTLVWGSSAESCVGDLFSTGATSPDSGSALVFPLVTTTYTITCTDEYGQNVSASFEVVVLPGPSITFTADPTSVQEGNPVELSWSVTGASTCTASGDWSGSRDPVGDTQFVNPFDDSTYVLRCSDIVGQIDTVSVDVTIAPEIDIFSADPVSIPLGGSSSLIWNSNHADSCVGVGFDTADVVNPLGPATIDVSPTATTTYTLTCSGPGGLPDVEPVTVVVGSAVMVDLDVDRSRVGLGQSTTIDWDSQNANSCTAVPNSDPAWTGSFDPAGGSISVSPTQFTTYVLNCIGAGDALGSGSVTIEIASPILVSLSTSDDVIALGDFATLSWTVARDNQSVAVCTASANPPAAGWSGGRNPNGGNRDVGPSVDTIYTLTCSDQFYTGATSTVTVEIAPIPTVTLDASQTIIAAGGIVELTWTSTDADRCAPTEPWTEDMGTSGTAMVSPIETTSYTIECFGLHETPGVAIEFVIVDPNRAVYNADSWGEDVEIRTVGPDTFAFVASYDNGLRILNLNTITNPIEVGSFDPVECINETPFGPETEAFKLEDVELDPIDPDLVYLSAGLCGFWTVSVDLANGFAAPVEISILDTEGWSEHATVVGNFAFISDYRGGVLIVDISVLDAPVAVRNLAFDSKRFGAALETQVVGDYAFVASSRGLRVIDVAIPAEAEIVAEVDTDVDRGFIPQSIVVHQETNTEGAVINATAYLSAWTGGLLFFNVLDPTTPLTAGIGRIATTDYAFYKMVVAPGATESDPDLLYVAEGELGIRVLDISNVGGFDPAPIVDQIDVGKFVWDIGIHEGQLYIGFGPLSDEDGEFADDEGGFQSIIDRP